MRTNRELDVSYGLTAVAVCFDDRTALGGVDFAVPEGRVSAVVGGDGAGKSTLLHCLAGTVQHARGEVRRPAKDVLGFMPSQSGTWANLTVDENISFVSSAYGLGGSALRRRREELLERADLGSARNRLAGDLSGGMRHKLGFIMAILHEPELLLLDEPSTGVDPVSRVELWRMIAETAANGTAVALSTTYLDEAERSSSILSARQGVAVASGTVADVIDQVGGTITARTAPTTTPARGGATRPSTSGIHPGTSGVREGTPPRPRRGRVPTGSRGCRDRTDAGSARGRTVSTAAPDVPALGYVDSVTQQFGDHVAVDRVSLSSFHAAR
ncbi:MAG: ABC transporter ATP-binding protein [Microthrixaceae bacterium]